MTGLASIPQIAQIPGLQAALDAKALASALANYAPLAGATFTGAVILGNGVVFSGTLGGGEFYSLAVSNAWEDEGTTFEAFRLNMVDSASDPGSLLMNLLKSSVSKFSVSKNGDVSVAGTVLAAAFAATGTISTFGGGIGSVSGTLVASAPSFIALQTWNNAAVNFTALLVNVTNTASGSNSLLADYQLNGTSVFSIFKDGSLSTTGTFLLKTNGTARFYIQSTNGLGYFTGNVNIDGPAGLSLGSGSGSPVGISRNAAGVLEVNNATPGSFRDLRLRELFDTNNARLLTTRLTAVADAAAASGTATVAGYGFVTLTEFNNFVTSVNAIKTTLNALLARCRATGGHGLIAD